jgi:long-chain acyl-CoA synthetase
MNERYGYVSAVLDATRSRLDQPAVLFDGRERSWSMLLDQAARLAGGLRRLGVAPGDRVAVLAHNCDRYIDLYLAIPWCGGVVAHLNWRWNVLENAYAIEDCRPKVLFVDDATPADDVARLRAAAPSMVVVGLGRALEGVLPFDAVLADPIEDARRSGDDLLAIYYTGGTTGRSKGVMLSHDGIVRNCSNARRLGLIPDAARVLTIAPLFHLGAGSCVTLTMLAGGTIILDKAFDPERALLMIERLGATDAFLVPTMIAMLLEHPAFRPERLASLRRIAYGSSPISAETLDRVLNVAPHIDFYQAYGMTEVCCTATVLLPQYHVGSHRVAGHHRSAGSAIPEVELMIVDEQGAPLPAGTVGEIWIGGRTLMLGYWNQPEATDAVLRDGWMHSGDGGYLDEHGLLYVVDRLKDMIVSGGENIYSAEVENALSRHPAVVQCAVIGVPDERWGERVHAVVSVRLNAAVTEEDIIEHCRSLIGRFKCPRSVEFRLDPLPMSAAGKILKHELRGKHWQGQSRQVA